MKTTISLVRVPREVKDFFQALADRNNRSLSAEILFRLDETRLELSQMRVHPSQHEHAAELRRKK
jgi:hypothetical protein